MRSALLCVFFAIIVQKDGSRADEDFRPTPIPLNEWSGIKEARAGTLHEVIGTEAPPVVAAVPAHYWEDALRHSVYLTLVRDKIDQLIAKGSVISPNSKPNTAQEVDDHDLWERIKTAPFDRLKEEPVPPGDITIMAKGRLLEEKDGFRFTEDEQSKEKCNNEKCMKGVKAFWSVKRVRQRDAETIPGKYHYELTFSVTSQTPKKQKNRYENPVRTFTVRESAPVEQPQHDILPPPVSYAPRPQRAIWFHKNIVPTSYQQGRKQSQGLDRIFSSWFSSEDEPRPEPPKYKPPYVPQVYPQHSKVGYTGAHPEQHQQKKLIPYPYKPQTYRYSRPPLGPPPVSHAQHHYIDSDPTIKSQHPPSHNDYKYLPSNIVKTTKPGIIPTPPISYPYLNVTMEMTSKTNGTETTTAKEPDIITAFTMYSKQKPIPTKMSYFPEHVRPPIFNAPPGVFLTMDKKPFKPMPPLKLSLHPSRPQKHRPLDFRPSPQVLDIQSFSDPDPLSDAFRPITMNYVSTTTETSDSAENAKSKQNNRKSKPPKKHENIKSQRITTNAPDIITAQSDPLEDIDWTKYLGAFSKTTPMASQKQNTTETTTLPPVTTVAITTTTIKSISSTTKAEEKITTKISTTTSKPKRTRPPPKFTKPTKVKKHKRITTTTTSTTSEKPPSRRLGQDLTPQASSPVTKTGWQPSSKKNITTTTSSPNTTYAASTTSEPSTTTVKIVPTTYHYTTTARQNNTSTESPSSTTEAFYTTVMTTQPKRSNRYRQSTLLHKGTSVNHDKWSQPTLDKNKTSLDKSKLVIPVGGTFPRRKGSNFHGYMSSTSKPVDQERNRENHVDHVSKIYAKSSSVTNTEATTTTQQTTQLTYDDSGENNEASPEDPPGTEEPDDDDDDEEELEEGNEENQEQVSRDNDELIFKTKDNSVTNPSEKPYEIESEPSTTEETAFPSHSRNKTRCKKKHQNLTATVETKTSIEVLSDSPTTTEKSTFDFIDDLFALNAAESTAVETRTKENETDSKYIENDEDLEEFLASINGHKDNDSNETNDGDYDDDDDKDDEEYSPFNNDEENRFARNTDSYDDNEERPFSLLELIAME